MSEGRKNDEGKARWSLLLSGCRLALIGAVRVLTLGADKYGENNWQQVKPVSRYVDALHRHMDAIHERGLTARDHESGELEAYHVLTNALFLAHFAALQARPPATVGPGPGLLPVVPPRAVDGTGHRAAADSYSYPVPTGVVPTREGGFADAAPLRKTD